jgi:rubrerythrin
MITDETRSEVAAELRKQAAYGSGSLGEWWQRLQDIVTGEIDFANPQETYLALADLIDPPIPARICEKCGGEWPSDITFENCPYCGTVVDDV